MRGFIDVIVRFIRAGQLAYTRKWTFLVLFAFVFVVSVYVLATLDLLPDARAASGSPEITLGAQETIATSTSPAVVAEAPVKIEISAIGLSATIANPDTTNVEILDEFLLKGAVRYPTSAKLGETGNVILFGHSSYLPVVNNQAYKTFNGIQRLVAGDTITVYSASAAYTYKVRTMTKESANDAAIPLLVTGNVLTLSTCNSFGQKSDRFVVVADLVERHSLPTNL